MRQTMRVLDELDAMLDRLKAREPRDWTLLDLLDASADQVAKAKALSRKDIGQFGQFGRFGRRPCANRGAGLSVSDDALHGSATDAVGATAPVASLSYTVQSVQQTSVGIVNQRLGFGHLDAPTVQKHGRIVQDRQHCEAAVICWLGVQSAGILPARSVRLLQAPHR